MKKKNCFCLDFLRCGLCGWCLECFWTGIGAILCHKDKKLFCRTSVWMFPIYGLAACMKPLFSRLRTRSCFLRGSIYMLGIFVVEYTTGHILKCFRACPWDYSKAKLNVKGLIRLDYAPGWFAAGLLFERLLCGKCKSKKQEK